MFSDIEEIKTLIETDSGLNLLTKKNSPFIISFLYKMFKTDSIQTEGIEQQYFVQKLASYLNNNDNTIDDDYDENDPLYNLELDNFDKALNLTKKWSNPDNQFIYRYYNDNNIEMIDLSTSVDRLFRYFEEIENLKSLFIGTESKFIEILDRIKELDQKTNKNPQARIDELQKRKLEIEKEINQIKETGEVEIYSHTQIKERVNSLDRVAKSLVSDFKQLRDNNHKVFSELCKKQLETTENRGMILSQILEQTEELQKTPQGESFNAFWLYLSNRKDKESIKNKISRINKKTPNHILDTEFFNNFEETLYKSGKNILEENRLLSEKLQKIITRKTSPEFKYISKLTKEIKTLCVNKNIDIPYKQEILSIDGNVDINNDMARPLELFNYQQANRITSYKTSEIPNFDLSQLVVDIHVNESLIKKNVEKYYLKTLNSKNELSVQNLFNEFPINYGLAEVLTYLSVIYKSKWAKIIDNEFENITYKSYTDDNKDISLSIPKVVINNE
ncbi:MAG: DUF3375 family protein [Pleomorphochaeta sp.]